MSICVQSYIFFYIYASARQKNRAIFNANVCGEGLRQFRGGGLFKDNSWQLGSSINDNSRIILETKIRPLRGLQKYIKITVMIFAFSLSLIRVWIYDCLLKQVLYPILSSHSLISQLLIESKCRVARGCLRGHLPLCGPHLVVRMRLSYRLPLTALDDRDSSSSHKAWCFAGALKLPLYAA